MIQNGKDTLLNQKQGSVPNMSDTLDGWMQPMSFERLTKTVINFVVQEVSEVITTEGVIQPFKDEMLQMKSEGQRDWKWWKLHTKPTAELKVDDVIVYLGAQYRVMHKKDFKLYGYFEYDMIEDYTGSGPE
jgi:hypothetical protein